MAVTYDVEIRNPPGGYTSLEFWQRYEEWFRQNLTGSVQVSPTGVHSFYTVVDSELISDLIQISTFKFSKQADALQFKLVFG